MYITYILNQHISPNTSPKLTHPKLTLPLNVEKRLDKRQFRQIQPGNAKSLCLPGGSVFYRSLQMNVMISYQKYQRKIPALFFYVDRHDVFLRGDRQCSFARLQSGIMLQA